MTEITSLINFRKQIPYKDKKHISRFCKKYFYQNQNCALIKEIKEKYNIIEDSDIIRCLCGYEKTCPICGKIFFKETQTCSQKCAHKLASRNGQQTNLKRYGVKSSLQRADVKEKIQQTNLKRYGVKNPQQSQIVQNKTKETNLKRYGVTAAAKSQIVKNKIRETNLERYGNACSLHGKEISKKVRETNLKKYGVEFVLQSQEIKDKIKQTNIERYGFEHPRQSKVIQEKTKETNLKKYGVENPFQAQVCKNKIKETCLAKYGVEFSAQAQEVKVKIKQRFQEKYGVDNPRKAQIIIDKIQEKKFNNYHDSFQETCLNYEHLNSSYFKTFICWVDNIPYFDMQKCRNFYGLTYKQLCVFKYHYHIEADNYFENNYRSNAEIYLFNWIPCENKISNDRNILNPLELDIVLPDYKLAIEYNGLYWHSELFHDTMYHLNKTLECNNKGIQLFHIFESDDIDIWKSMISNKLGLNTNVYARKCTVKEITNSDAKSFCAQNHLQGACNAKINLGLFYNDELLEVMTFGKPRYNKHYEYELLRLCTKKYYSVIGGASKLWKCFCQKYSPKSVISYANRRFSNGNIYETLGFDRVNETKPNYWYVKGDIILSRVQCQKHKLKSFLETFDENSSEVDNMLNNGYARIFDCGNLVYVTVF